MNLSEIIHIWWLALLNINILWNFVRLIDVFAYLLSMNSSVEIVFVIISILLYWFHYIPVLLSVIIEALILYYFYWILECNYDIPIRWIWYTGYLHIWNRFLEGGIWCKNHIIALKWLIVICFFQMLLQNLFH